MEQNEFNDFPSARLRELYRFYNIIAYDHASLDEVKEQMEARMQELEEILDNRQKAI